MNGDEGESLQTAVDMPLLGEDVHADILRGPLTQKVPYGRVSIGTLHQQQPQRHHQQQQHQQQQQQQQQPYHISPRHPHQQQHYQQQLQQRSQQQQQQQQQPLQQRVEPWQRFQCMSQSIPPPLAIGIPNIGMSNDQHSSADPFMTYENINTRGPPRSPSKPIYANDNYGMKEGDISPHLHSNPQTITHFPHAHVERSSTLPPKIDHVIRQNSDNTFNTSQHRSHVAPAHYTQSQPQATSDSIHAQQQRMQHMTASTSSGELYVNRSAYRSGSDLPSQQPLQRNVHNNGYDQARNREVQTAESLFKSRPTYPTQPIHQQQQISAPSAPQGEVLSGRYGTDRISSIDVQNADRYGLYETQLKQGWNALEGMNAERTNQSRLAKTASHGTGVEYRQTQLQAHTNSAKTESLFNFEGDKNRPTDRILDRGNRAMYENPNRHTRTGSMTYVEPPSSTRVNILPQSQDDKGLMYASRTASETVNTAATVRPEIPVRRSEPVAVYASIVPQYQQTLGSIAGCPSPRVSTPSPGLAYSPADTIPHTNTHTRTAHQEQVGNQRHLSEHIQPLQPAHSQPSQQSSNQPASSATEYIQSNTVAYLQQHSHPASGDAGYGWQPRDVDVSDRAKSDHQVSSRGQQPVDMKQTHTHTHLELPTTRRRSVQNAPTSPLLSPSTARRRQSPARAHTLDNSGPVLESSANGTQLSAVGSATAGQDNAVDGERNIVDASDELNELRRAISLPPSTGAETGLGMNIMLGTEGQAGVTSTGNPDVVGRLDAELHKAHADGHMLTHEIAAIHMDNTAVTPGAGHVPLSPITSQQLRDGVNITVSANTHDHQGPHPHRVYFDEASSRRAQTLTPTVPQRQSDECILPKLENGNERVQLDRVSMGTYESSANQPTQDMQSLDSKGGYWGSPLFNSDGAPNVGTSMYRHSSYPAPTTPTMKALAITEDEHSQFALGKMLTMGGAPVSPLGRSEANIDSAGDMNAGIQQATPTKAYKQRPLSAPTQPSQGLAQIPVDPTLGGMVVAQPHASMVEHPNAQEHLPVQTYDSEQVQIQLHAQAQAPMDLHYGCVSIVQYESLKYQSSNIENALKRELMTTRKRLEKVKDERDLAERRLREFQYLANVMQPSDFGGSGLINFRYDELQHATNNWDDKNKIGEGGFGPVYRGVLHGQSVAIKTQSTGSDQGALEFAREVAVLAKYRHKHLVSLMGIVRSASYLCLVYEYMSLGSVRDVLDHKGLGVDALPLTWIDRISISLQSAKGLLYLHRGTTPPVLHLDFKTANILLDKDLHAKVADFGLVRSTPELMQGTHAMTRRLNGTHGYICPEYASSGRITDRTDVYSFGVVLLEMLTGLRAIDETLPVADLVNRVKDYTKFRCRDFKSRQRVSMSTDVSGERNFSGSTLTALDKMYTEREAPGNQQIEFDTVRERELAQLQRYTSSDNVSIDPDRVRNVMDGIHSDGDWPLDQVTRFLSLALHCTKSRATKRPTMSEAMGRLEEMYLLAEGERTGDFNLTAFNKKKSLDRMTSDIGESVVSPVKLAAESPTENDTLCVICCSAPRSAEFQPCGHCVLCHNCAMGMATNGDSCPTCLTKIDEVLSRFEVV